MLNFPKKAGDHIKWGGINSATASFAISQVAEKFNQPLVVITQDMHVSTQLRSELAFLLRDQQIPVFSFPDWETLPYDHFSPHQAIISDRLHILSKLPYLDKGVVIITITNLMHRLAPREFIEQHCFYLRSGERLSQKAFRERLEKNGYQLVSQVMSHGEYSVRGGIIDVFPMGSDLPFRIEWFDEEVDTIRSFDPETQLTINKTEKIDILLAREFPLNEEGVAHFRQSFRTLFDVNPLECPIYQNLSQEQVSSGIEYYLPLFFKKTEHFFDYLNKDSLLIEVGDLNIAAQNAWKNMNERYEQLRYDITRPLLEPKALFLPVESVFSLMRPLPRIRLCEGEGNCYFNSEILPDLSAQHQAKDPLQKLKTYIQNTSHRILFCAESAGRREALLTLFQKSKIMPTVFTGWSEFLKSQASLGLIVAPFEVSCVLTDMQLSIITEAQLFSQKVIQKRARKAKVNDFGTIIHSLSELTPGDPVVHIQHGVGRYQGLQTLTIDNVLMEYLTLEYADHSKLYVPVSSLHLINRFSGVDAEHAPMHQLGSNKWEKAKRKATQKIKDVAAELLDVYARRNERLGFVYKKPEEYEAFAEGFPFEETPDQQTTIEHILNDMMSPRPMDRLVCGDVGFGKTEVAMRAAFVAIQNHKQVAVLVPTTVLAEQHYQNFKTRFADWPIEVGVLSRFSTPKQQKAMLEKIKGGSVDIVVGTHKLLQPQVVFKQLGLLIVDEEHRFGVSHKEKIKAKKVDVDVLTLTATPIPRTLNMAMQNVRDLSIMATPPLGRLSVKTFVKRYERSLIREAILRENLRGGQTYFLHNRVETIQTKAEELQALIPDLKIGIAHGQMPENQLEKVMADFYHQRFHVLLCTTIIESGIDVPTANTIIIDRADRLGLAQLHQLRGRVGRSHHQAYAYLLIPDVGKITKDSERRLEALANLEELGAGFNLASHDLEIRGAGELLGDEQSGHIQTIGFTLYMELLERAVQALKKGESLDLDQAIEQTVEVDLRIPALIPDHYMPDLHHRLIFYKRIANAKDQAALDELQVELIDRFGLLPDAVKYLFEVTQIKLKAEKMDIEKITAAGDKIQVQFIEKRNNEMPHVKVDELIKLIQIQPAKYQLKGNQKVNITLEEGQPEEKIKALSDLLDRIRA